jgi:hypothetical protein
LAVAGLSGRRDPQYRMLVIDCALNQRVCTYDTVDCGRTNFLTCKVVAGTR